MRWNELGYDREAILADLARSAVSTTRKTDKAWYRDQIARIKRAIADPFDGTADPPPPPTYADFERRRNAMFEAAERGEDVDDVPTWYGYRAEHSFVETAST
jgi:hypothetical protein